MAYSVFISHSVSPADYSLVTTIANLLWQHGVQTYIPEIYPTGKTVAEQTALQIEHSDAILVVVTQDTVRSAWVNQEIGFARAKGRRILPLVERGINPEGFLHDLKWVEFDRFNFNPVAEEVTKYLKEQADKKAADESKGAWGALGAVVVAGLVLWALSQGGKEEK